MISPDDYENEFAGSYEDEKHGGDAIHVEGEDSPDQRSPEESPNNESAYEDEGMDPDAMQDAYVNGFLKDLMNVGTFSKQILNYSYPPLLYQRGDDSEGDDQDDDGDIDEDDDTSNESPEDSEEELSHNQFGDDFNMDNILG